MNIIRFHTSPLTDASDNPTVMAAGCQNPVVNRSLKAHAHWGGRLQEIKSQMINPYPIRDLRVDHRGEQMINWSYKLRP